MELWPQRLRTVDLSDLVTHEAPGSGRLCLNMSRHLLRAWIFPGLSGRFYSRIPLAQVKQYRPLGPSSRQPETQCLDVGQVSWSLNKYVGTWSLSALGGLKRQLCEPEEGSWNLQNGEGSLSLWRPWPLTSFSLETCAFSLAQEQLWKSGSACN